MTLEPRRLPQALAALRELAVRRVHVVLVVATLLAAAWLRAPALDNPSFSTKPTPTRQYRAAIIARALYYDLSPPDERARRRTAERAGKRLGMLEPPITESLAAVGYLIAGAETPIVPRVLTSLLWLAGGVFVYRLVRLVFSPEAALVALGFQVLTVHSVVASRSFQPEALLVLALTFALLRVVHHHLVPDRKNFWFAAAATGFAVLVKPVSACFLIPAFGCLALGRDGLRRTLTKSENWLYLAVGLALPSSFYLASSLLASDMRDQAAMTFTPALVFTKQFWAGWLAMIDRTHGRLPMVLGAVGVALAPRGTARALFASLWSGYVVYALAFAYHVSSHAYYQVPFVPVLAASLASLASALLRLVPSRAPAAGTAIVVAGLAIGARYAADEATRVFEKRSDRAIAMYRAIGSAVHSSDRVVFLSPEAWGGALQYHAPLAGWYLESRGGRGDKNEATLRELVNRREAAYFVATDLDELRRQRRVAAYLERHHRVIHETERAVVYDLRSPRESADVRR
jgi:hypothetical protein